MTNQTNPPVQTVLAIDALTCLGAGVLMLTAANPIAALTGLPANLLTIAGIALLPVAALFFGMSRAQSVPAPLLWVAVLGNAGWIAASLAVLAIVPANGLGVAFVLVQAAAVLALTLLEARSLGGADRSIAA